MHGRVSQNFPGGTYKQVPHVQEVWGYSRKENSKRPTTFGETLCCPCDPNFTKEILKNTKENLNFSVFNFNIKIFF